MTAIAGVLNKHGIAIAADSAVTFGNTHKVVNNGNKIFTLSKYAPVGIATYGRLSLMSTPWDIVIKQYRKQLGEKRYSHLCEYVEDFFSYIKTNLYFTDDLVQHTLVQDYITLFQRKVDEKVKVRCSQVPGKDYSVCLKECLNEFIGVFGKPEIVCPEFSDYSYEDFIKYANIELNTAFSSFHVAPQPDLFDLFSHSLFCYLRNGNRMGNGELIPLFTSGLVFFGYGEDDLYPSVISKETSIVFDGHLKYCDGEGCVIGDHDSAASVIPYAQIDVTQTIVRGIHPGFYDILSRSFIRVLQDYSSLIIETINKNNPELTGLKNAITKLQLAPLARQFNDMASSEFQRLYTQPLIQTVVNLDKEDMANMAESFVSLTSLIRRMSPGEETVGGPVDVAFVSKGDGFIWIKRKFYFKPELNYHFLENYFKS
ncbi:MAG: hypothetical protein J6W18_00240 [Bacteroidaceae bacterium]|nr:hypothetical protein [Bacteroidaceae bacterium]